MSSALLKWPVAVASKAESASAVIMIEPMAAKLKASERISTKNRSIPAMRNFAKKSSMAV